MGMPFEHSLPTSTQQPKPDAISVPMPDAFGMAAYHLRTSAQKIDQLTAANEVLDESRAYLKVALSAAQEKIDELTVAKQQLEARASAAEAAAVSLFTAKQAVESELASARVELQQKPSSSEPPPKKKIDRQPALKADRVCSAGAPAKDLEADYSTADSTKWIFSTSTFNGASTFSSINKEKVSGKISEGAAAVKANPAKYLAVMYQTDMTEWPEDQQSYVLIHRKGTKGYEPSLRPDGWMTLVRAQYQCLPPLDNLGAAATDEFVDTMAYDGFTLHHTKNVPLLPGRGQGVGDVPSLKFIGDVDPSDLCQGSVGDCWLLAGISSLAEYDGAIMRLFRKTPGLDKLPADAPSKYTITLSVWDLPTWSEVDIVIDERLAAKADGSGLLGCSVSQGGELWACYLEKALSIHCGGWDKINGGQCTHAWALLTGCKEQYTIRRGASGKYGCLGKYNPNEERWETLANSPHDGFDGLWPMRWPEVGSKVGSGDKTGLGLELTEEELFERMCCWDDHNYIIAAGTKSGSDTKKTDGIVDGHAYSVLECCNDVAGTEFDLIKVRNPWGSGEFESGMWDDDGPGWEQYPQVKAALKPVAADDGIFWLSKSEFFRYFPSIYLCAADMSKMA